MSDRKRSYDSTVARIAGNIASGLVSSRVESEPGVDAIVTLAVRMARRIVAETERTEPAKDIPEHVHRYGYDIASDSMMCSCGHRRTAAI